MLVKCSTNWATSPQPEFGQCREIFIPITTIKTHEISITLPHPHYSFASQSPPPPPPPAPGNHWSASCHFRLVLPAPEFGVDGITLWGLCVHLLGLSVLFLRSESLWHPEFTAFYPQPGSATLAFYLRMNIWVVSRWRLLGKEVCVQVLLCA